MRQTASVQSPAPASRSLRRRWLMCILSELSVQSGVSSAMRSSSWERVTTWPGFSMSSFNALLKNRKYIGEYRYQDVVIPGGVPAIVPE